MLEKKWNNIAPEVPQDFHNKFEDTLKQIEQADSVDKKYKRKKIRRCSTLIKQMLQVKDIRERRYVAVY